MGRGRPGPGVGSAAVPSVRGRRRGNWAHLVALRFRLLRAPRLRAHRRRKLVENCLPLPVLVPGHCRRSSTMSTGDSFETRFEKIDNLLRDPKSEVNSDCLLVSKALLFPLARTRACLCLPLAFRPGIYLQEGVTAIPIYSLGKPQNLAFFVLPASPPTPEDSWSEYLCNLLPWPCLSLDC